MDKNFKAHEKRSADTDDKGREVREKKENQESFKDKMDNLKQKFNKNRKR